ncbi:hypothetical protein TCON_0127 [Astathelohania contejeani]|uniref:Uncharacterized protein n=1 Tax=Astathelohania contejeani TaxID=164912 RepID=A0ABQ7I2G2_9MICR|nr:hypothetical protein TCON_0127 [Thelohania contejeani]
MNEKETRSYSNETHPTKSELRDTMLAMVDHELWLLKREICSSISHTGHPRSLIDFETQTNNGLAASKKIKKSSTQRIEIGKRENIKNCILKSQKYFVEAYNLPLYYILINSQKVVFTSEWITAIKEQEHIKLLQKIDHLRKENKFIVKQRVKWQIELIEMRNNIINRNKRARGKLKKIIYEISKAQKQNLIYENLEIRLLKCKKMQNNNIFFKNIKATIEPITPTCNKLEVFKRYTNIFNLMKGNASKANYPVPVLKKNSGIHSSYISTANKIPPEVAKLVTPIDFANYLISKKNYNSQDKNI